VTGPAVDADAFAAFEAAGWEEQAVGSSHSKRRRALGRAARGNRTIPGPRARPAGGGTEPYPCCLRSAGERACRGRSPRAAGVVQDRDRAETLSL